MMVCFAFNEKSLKCEADEHIDKISDLLEERVSQQIKTSLLLLSPSLSIQDK